MKFVELECPFGNYLVIPEHVSWIQLTGPNVSKVGFLGGSEINTIRGKPEEIVATLRGEAQSRASESSESESSE